MEIMFGKGISASGSLLDAAVKYEIIEKKGAWFSYGEEKVGQGRENAKEFLERNPELSAQIAESLRKIMFPERSADETPTDDPAFYAEPEIEEEEPVAFNAPVKGRGRPTNEEANTRPKPPQDKQQTADAASSPVSDPPASAEADDDDGLF
jgi:recombination protein RecA